MTLHLTPEMMEAAYELLRTTRPFKRWVLPHADDVEFRVTADKSDGGFHVVKNYVHCIGASTVFATSLSALNAILAHEMCHVYVTLEAPSYKPKHGAKFSRAAAAVNRHHKDMVIGTHYTEPTFSYPGATF